MTQGSELTDMQLWKAAHVAGHQLFGESLSFFPFPILRNPERGVKRLRLSELQASGEGQDHVDDYEFIFFPRKGGGLDVSDQSWCDARPTWVDSDGFIYTAWADGIIQVIEVDVALTVPS